jgi:periplasmic protein TonB
MKSAFLLGIGAAVVLHAGVLLFGGIFFLKDEKDHGTLQQVDLLAAEDVDQPKEKEKPKEESEEEKQELEAEDEPPPDAAELMRDLERSAVADAPALDAASLGAIEAALNGQGGGGDFADALSFASGGRIGGTGKAGALDDKMDAAFTMAEIDQKPRVVYQAAALYPGELRAKKLEGVATVIFVVDATGKVESPRVLSSTHPAFDKPALDAVKQWKFEPAVKAGQRVGCKVRVSIRSQPS